MDELADLFGRTNPKLMSPHFFFGAVQVNLSNAVRANVDKQNYSTCPRYWYVEAVFLCQDCAVQFTWTTDEQGAWFEEYGFYVDSRPTRCMKCRGNKRRLKSLRQEYDRTVGRARAGGSLEEKKHVLSLIDQIEELSKAVPKSGKDVLECLPRKGPAGIERTRALLLKQVRRIEGIATAGEE